MKKPHVDIVSHVIIINLLFSTINDIRVIVVSNQQGKGSIPELGTCHQIGTKMFHIVVVFNNFYFLIFSDRKLQQHLRMNMIHSGKDEVCFGP
jgi:hypothetical protein